jgi:hypothetical protein
MPRTEPVTELDPRYSSGGATPTPWSTASAELETAEIYWISTVRPDGRPHVTPMIGLWLDDALYFCTGPDERKAANLAHNPQCAVTTGRNTLGSGLDITIEGAAVEINDEDRLRRLAEHYATKYGWRFTVRDGAFLNDEGGRALVYVVVPQTAHGFGKGETFSQTRYRFDP